MCKINSEPLEHSGPALAWNEQYETKYVQYIIPYSTGRLECRLYVFHTQRFFLMYYLYKNIVYGVCFLLRSRLLCGLILQSYIVPLPNANLHIKHHKMFVFYWFTLQHLAAICIYILQNEIIFSPNFAPVYPHDSLLSLSFSRICDKHPQSVWQAANATSHIQC